MAEIPLIVINVQRGGPSTGMPTNVEQSDLLQALYGSQGAPRVVLPPATSRSASMSRSRPRASRASTATPVIILSDQGLASRIEAFDEPDLQKLMKDPKPDLSERGADFKPYPWTASPGTPPRARASPLASTRPSPDSSTMNWGTPRATRGCTRR